MSDYKPTAWGLVTRDVGNGKELLVATRYKSGDELRQGQLVIPGGGLEEGELSYVTAIRETEEETNIYTQMTDSDKFYFNFKNRQRLKLGKLEYFTLDSQIYLEYKDSGKKYSGYVVDLAPLDPFQEPMQTESDAKDPKYVNLSEIKTRINEFTPACQAILLLLKEDGFLEW